MPRLWEHTIDAHRRSVRDAVLDAAWTLVSERGLLSVTMAAIAQEAGIGRATLYKYFPDVEAVLLAWHSRQVGQHLHHLTALAHTGHEPRERLEAVLTAYATICHHRGHAASDLVALLHRDSDAEHAEQQVEALARDLLAQAGAAGAVRTDVPPDELASYCLHALTAAGDLDSEDGVPRLVSLTLSALQHPT